MTGVPEQEAKDAIRSWVISRTKTAPGLIGDTTPLFAERHLTSLHVPELLLLLEELRGEPVDPQGLAAGDFRDIDTIVQRFCAPRPAGDQKEDTYAESSSAESRGGLG